MKKKILFLLKLPPPITGATIMNQRVYNSNLLRKNFTIRTITVSYAKNVADLGKLSLNKIYVFFRFFFKLLYQLFFYRPDLVYFQISPLSSAFLRDIIFVTIIKIFNSRILFHLHGKGIKKQTKRFFLNKIYKFSFNKSHIICLSHFLVKDIENIYRHEPFVVNNCLLTQDFFPKEEKQNFKPVILFISNLFLSKGINDFIEALYILKEKGIDFRGKIIGREADLCQESLSTLLNRKKLNVIVKYLGAKYNGEKNKELLSSDIFVHPTREDAFPLVILEAMQAGLPIISTYEGAIPEIIDDGITGFIVDKNSPEQIAEKLEVLIKKPELRKQMGEAGRKKFLENYTIEKFEQNMLRVFNKVLRK